MPPRKLAKKARAKRAPAEARAAEPAPKMITRSCSRCGRTETCPEGGLPPGWSMGMEGRRMEYLDPDCARANIRAIEGRLTEEYWEF